MGRNLASLVAGVQCLLVVVGCCRLLSVAVAAESGYGLQATDYRFCTRRCSTSLSLTITCSATLPCGASASGHQ